MDPPSYGRGPNKEVWKFENDFPTLLSKVKDILDEDFSFLLISSYTTGISHISLENILKLEFKGNKIETGENTLPVTENNLILPCGIYGKVTKINIIYEDNHLLVIEKPVGIPVQADSSNAIDLITLLKEYRIKKENKKGDAYIGLVHRLDRPVGGIMVFAKTSKAASRLSDEIRKNNFHKTYYAVVEGTLPKEGKFEDYLIKNEKENISYVTTKEKGKYSCLEYTLISSKNNLSLVKINLITGRSHQIRVQFSSRHHPLVGDSKYGDNPKNIDIALFAQTLTFTHPTTKEVLTFNLDLPNRYPFNIFK